MPTRVRLVARGLQGVLLCGHVIPGVHKCSQAVQMRHPACCTSVHECLKGHPHFTCAKRTNRTADGCCTLMVALLEDAHSTLCLQTSGSIQCCDFPLSQLSVHVTLLVRAHCPFATHTIAHPLFCFPSAEALTPPPPKDARPGSSSGAVQSNGSVAPKSKQPPFSDCE